MKLQLNFQIVRFLNYKQRFSDSLPQFNSSEVGKFTSANVWRDGAIGDLAHSRRLLITFSVIYKI